MENLPGATYLTASGLVTGKPALIIAVLHRSGAGGAGISTIYDGENTTLPISFTISAAAGASTPFTPAEPVTAQRGIYVSLDANTASILILWKHK